MAVYLQYEISSACLDDTERQFRLMFTAVAEDRGWSVKHKIFSSGLRHRPLMVFSHFYGRTLGAPHNSFGYDGDLYTQISVHGNVTWVKLYDNWRVSQPYIPGSDAPVQWHPTANRRVFDHRIGSLTWVSTEAIESNAAAAGTSSNA